MRESPGGNRHGCAIDACACRRGDPDESSHITLCFTTTPSTQLQQDYDAAAGLLEVTIELDLANLSRNALERLGPLRMLLKCLALRDLAGAAANPRFAELEAEALRLEDIHFGQVRAFGAVDRALCRCAYIHAYVWQRPITA